jgi:uncharacterized membrane protein (UPF0127 family)
VRPAALLPLALIVGACQAESQPAPAAKPAAPAASVATSPISGLALAPLEIRAGGKVHRFTVELARTPEEQAYGLMNRTRLGDQEGMLFPFDPPRPASFWMKNTLIPLDMIFVRADGSIARIAAMTTPLSENTWQVGEPVAAVLELRGGRAAELGIDEEARISWPGGPRP